MAAYQLIGDPPTGDFVRHFLAVGYLIYLWKIISIYYPFLSYYDSIY